MHLRLAVRHVALWSPIHGGRYHTLSPLSLSLGPRDDSRRNSIDVVAAMRRNRYRCQSENSMSDIQIAKEMSILVAIDSRDVSHRSYNGRKKEV